MKYLSLFLLFLIPSLVQAAPPRNVVMIVADDHGRDLGCYGNKEIRTPNLDQLAADGTRFEYAFCTTASCSASRSVILTGLQNHLNGQYGHQHHFHHFSSFPSVKSLPVILAGSGYRTAQIGKYHVAPESIYHFDTYLQANARNPVAMAEKCKEFLTAKSDKPFFLYFATADPHRGGGILETDPHKPDRFGNGPNYPGIVEEKYESPKLSVHPFLPDTAACQSEIAQYYQSIARVDQGVGRLVQILKDAGQYENTLILYLSDNGMAFPGSKTTLYEPGMRLPLIVRQPGLKKQGGVCNAMVTWADLTPTILEYAGITSVEGPPAQGQPGPEIPGRAAGAGAGKKNPKAKPYEFHGRSFLTAMNEESPKGWNEIYASHTFHEITMYYPMRVVRNRQFKLTLNIAHQLPFPFASDLEASATWKSIKESPNALYGKRLVKDFLHRPHYELYDLKADPHEVRNLAGDPKHADTLKDLQGRLKTFQEKTGDPWVVKYVYE